MSFLLSNQLDLFQQSDQDLEEGTGMSAIEKKYGKNELDHLQMCPRCREAVPVRVEMDYKHRKVRWYCRKCEASGHTKGALIKEWVMADYCWPITPESVWREPIRFYDKYLSKVEMQRING